MKIFIIIFLGLVLIGCGYVPVENFKLCEYYAKQNNLTFVGLRVSPTYNNCECDFKELNTYIYIKTIKSEMATKVLKNEDN